MSMQNDIDFECPCCHGSLLGRQDESLVCPVCKKQYPFSAGLPILINDQNSVFAIEDYISTTSYSGDKYGREGDSASGIRKIYRRLGNKLIYHAIGRQYLGPTESIKYICEHSEKTPRILIIGAGDIRHAAPADIVYTDVALGKDLTCICDAHDIPFAAASFDAVVAVAVFEHVADPYRCASEVWRVLKPRGYVYSATPFLQPVHMGAYDFTRFTPLGHRRLFRWFDEVQSGIALGPGAVSAWVGQHLLVSLSDNRHYRRLAKLAGLLLTLPLKYLDYLACRQQSALDAAGGVYFLGQRREDPIADRHLIGLYRGGFSTPQLHSGKPNNS
jgi:SAM-dependent methyltransferase